MTDLLALRTAVLLSPSDDVARGVYADACLESGDAAAAVHGELILLQLANADADRQRVLIADHLLASVPRHPGLAVSFARGFVSAVKLSDPTAGTASDAPWSETTVGMVAERHARAVAALFADHPLEAIEVAVGPAEAWRVSRIPDPMSVAPWTFRRPGVIGSGVAASTRDELARKMQAKLHERLLALGQHVLHVQRGERDNREWGAGIL